MGGGGWGGCMAPHCHGWVGVEERWGKWGGVWERRRRRKGVRAFCGGLRRLGHLKAGIVRPQGGKRMRLVSCFGQNGGGGGEEEEA